MMMIKNLFKKAKNKVPSVMAGASSASSFMGGTPFASAGIGGIGGAMMADEGNRTKGFLGGAFTGMVGGAAMRGYAQYGAATSRKALGRMSGWHKSAVTNPKSPDFITDNYRQHRRAVAKAAVGFHKKSNRNHIFRSGAMLGGGAFGLMFAGNGKSHRRGFNANRGNGFGR